MINLDRVAVGEDNRCPYSEAEGSDIELLNVQQDTFKLINFIFFFI